MATSKQPVFTKFLWYFLDDACDPHPHPENLHDFIRYFSYFQDNYLDEGEDPCLPFDFDFSSWKNVDKWAERLASEKLSPELEEQLDADTKQGYIIEEKNFSNYKKWLEESGIALVSVKDVDFGVEHGCVEMQYVIRYCGKFYEFRRYHSNGCDDFTDYGTPMKEVTRHERVVVEYR